MRPPQSDQWLTKYSSQHLLHELKMFWWLVRAIPSQKDGYMHDALLESFVVHLRNLIFFSCKEWQDDSDVVASDFLVKPGEWNERESPKLADARFRANKELSHLTTDRKDEGDPNIPEKT
jgi:hypothetical protein